MPGNCPDRQTDRQTDTVVLIYKIATKLHNHISKYIYFVKNKVRKRLIKKM